MVKILNISLSRLFKEDMKITSDSIGVFASGLCMLHCLATPIFFIVSACSSACCNNAPIWWQWMDYIFLAISFFAIQNSSKSSTKDWVIQGLWINWAALIFFIINAKFGWFLITPNLKFLPAFGLVFLHMYNMKYCQCEEKGCCQVEHHVKQN